MEIDFQKEKEKEIFYIFYKEKGLFSVVYFSQFIKMEETGKFNAQVNCKKMVKQVSFLYNLTR